MSSIVALDARPITQIAHPRKFDAISEWVERVAASGRRVVVPEVADYEARRGLLRKEAPRQLEELDVLLDSVLYLPLDTAQMRRAAEVWADARQSGRPFTDDDRLDGDAILIAQTEELGDRRSVTFITKNEKHFSHYINAMWWKDFTP
jgi:predicted nucleic acid-binding protein